MALEGRAEGGGKSRGRREVRPWLTAASRETWSFVHWDPVLLSWPDPGPGRDDTSPAEWPGPITFARPSEAAGGKAARCKMCFPLDLN